MVTIVSLKKENGQSYYDYSSYKTHNEALGNLKVLGNTVGPAIAKIKGLGPEAKVIPVTNFKNFKGVGSASRAIFRKYYKAAVKEAEKQDIAAEVDKKFYVVAYNTDESFVVYLGDLDESRNELTKFGGNPDYEFLTKFDNGGKVAVVVVNRDILEKTISRMSAQVKKGSVGDIKNIKGVLTVKNDFVKDVMISAVNKRLKNSLPDLTVSSAEDELKRYNRLIDTLNRFIYDVLSDSYFGKYRSSDFDYNLTMDGVKQMFKDLNDIFK